jgi:DNA repair protein RecO (recombination protein O)
MLVNSRGIVLSTLRFSDSSVIARIYTEQAGQKSFLIRVGKGRAAFGKMAMLQPLSLVELAFSLDDRHGLRTPSVLERSEMLQNIPFDTVKSTIAIFMAEVLGRSLHEETPDAPLFEFLHHTILLLDNEAQSCSNFHLKFLIEFTRFMGCHPEVLEDELPFFDLHEGTFCTVLPIHPNYIDGLVKDAFVALLSTPLSHHAAIQLSNHNRRLLLQALLDYYRFHIAGMREIRSHVVLEEVMS